MPYSFLLNSPCFFHLTSIILLSHEFNSQMVREMDEILRQPIAEPANSCKSEDNSVSFLDQVISPLYEVVAAVCLSSYLEIR